MSKSSVDEYLQILLYIPNRIKEHIVEKNTIKELITGVAGSTSSLSQYAPKNAITLNIPSMLQIKNNIHQQLEDIIRNKSRSKKYYDNIINENNLEFYKSLGYKEVGQQREVAKPKTIEKEKDNKEKKWR